MEYFILEICDFGKLPGSHFSNSRRQFQPNSLKILTCCVPRHSKNLVREGGAGGGVWRVLGGSWRVLWGFGGFLESWKVFGRSFGGCLEGLGGIWGGVFGWWWEGALEGKPRSQWRQQTQ